MTIRKIIISALGALIALSAFGKAKPFTLQQDSNVKVAITDESAPVVQAALKMLSGDIKNVLGDSVVFGTYKKADIIITGASDENIAVNEADYLRKNKESFLLKVLPSGKLLIAGGDAHGTAYGILEVSRLMGVSPWEWWADATPRRASEFCLPAGFTSMQAPDVEYRGIFINDEDWGLMPWSSSTMEPQNERGVIGTETTRRIFELLLRLRANTYWPPMHECSRPFFLTDGNREVAKEYGIYIGSSHCEPMACNAAGEWSRRGKGEYDYVNNSANVLDFWRNRVKDVASQPILYTIGMRGVHDGSMQGANTAEEQKTVLEKVFSDQRNLLKEYVDKDITAIPQVFIPYKEVLDIYNAGLSVPDDVTLMWCDDNYGYIRHFPTEEERNRKGGNGIYYHVSYWGRPHDYLWLGTTSPYLISQQMTEAYDRGIRRMWILNVGDIKPAEYQIELFMDMAWDMDGFKNKGVDIHLNGFLSREFGKKAGNELTPLMKEHYRLAFIRKPEFLGNTRTEEWGTDKWNHVSDLAWSDSYINRRLKEYRYLSDKVEHIFKNTPSDRLDTYFQLVKYPVQAAAQMNEKMLNAQLARHGKADWNKSDAAFDSICALTAIYNTGISNKGKWNGIMDFQPRKQPVFEPVEHTASENLYIEPSKALTINGMDFASVGLKAYPGLGYNGKAAGVSKGESASYTFKTPELVDSLTLTVKLLPTHPIVIGNSLKFSISVDGSTPVVIDYATEGRSEEWKENVLRNQAIRTITVPVSERDSHEITFTALTDGVVLDQIIIN